VHSRSRSSCPCSTSRRGVLREERGAPVRRGGAVCGVRRHNAELSELWQRSAAISRPAPPTPPDPLPQPRPACLDVSLTLPSALPPCPPYPTPQQTENLHHTRQGESA
jgi:hypothetical protein